MDGARLGALLGAAHSPVAPPAERSAAEAELQALARTPAALHWALATLQSPHGLQPAAGWFACAVVDGAVAHGWPRLDPPLQAAVRACLWASATSPAAPHFQRAKLAASLAHLACLDGPEAWPDFLPALQAALADAARREAAVDLLATTLDHFHALAQTTSAGLKGNVPSAAVPAIQQRYRDLHPWALATLGALLQQLRGVQGRDSAATALAGKALRSLRAALAAAGARLPEGQDINSAALAELLFDYVSAARLAPPDDEAVAQVSAAALDCAADLCARFLGSPDATRQLLEALLPRLQDACALLGERWAHGGGAAQLEDPVPAAFVRLLAQFFSTQLSNVEATPHLGAQLHALLDRLLPLATARRSPADLLLLLEAWHAVLGYVGGFEDQLWECEGDDAAAARVAAAVAAFRGPILAVADLVLSTLGLAGATAPPPFTIDALSAAPGSGGAIEEWLASVAAGGDAAEGEEAGAEHGGEGEEGEADELLVAGCSQGGRAFQADSERDVYERRCEGFLGQVVGTYSAAAVPRILLRLQPAAAAFAAACEAAAAAAQGQHGQGQQGAAVEAALEAQLPASRGMDLCLRLLVRCGPHFPTRGAAGAPAALDGSGDGGGPAVSGAHAVQALRALFHLTDGWLRSVLALAAAAQSAGPPATPAHAGGGRGAGLRAKLAAGGRLHTAAGALTATWLSQLVMGLVRGNADPDAAAAAQELVHGALASGAGLLSALASPALDGGWRPLLHQPAVWAAESLVSLSSIALSSSLKPPVALLDALWRSGAAQALLQAHVASLANPALLPLRAARALGLCLSDLALRCWPAQPAQFDSEARGAAFTSVAGPLVQLLQAAAGAGAGASSEAALAAVRQAAAVANTTVQSFAGSPKQLRSIVGTALVTPILPSAVDLLRLGSSSGGGGSSGAASKPAAALLRLVACALEVLPTELGSDSVEQLLSALVQALSASGCDPSFEADLQMLRLLSLVLSQGGAQRHRSLVQPALRYMLALWERAGSPQAAAAAGADPWHVRAAALGAMLSTLRYKWQALVGSSVMQANGGHGSGGGGQPAASAHPVAAAAASAAAAQQQQQQQGGDGGALASQALRLLLDLFGAAAGLQVVLAAADVRLVLEELFELQVATRLYALPLFRPVWAPLAEALLALLASRLYTAAADDLGDTLFSLAAANWSEFLLQVLPGFVERRGGGGGASERAALVGLFGASDLDAHTFEAALRRFVNDCGYLQRAW